MKAKTYFSFATCIVLLFNIHGTLLKAQLIDPATVTLNQHNLGDYLNAVRKVFIELGNPGNTPDEVENHRIQMEYLLEAGGYRMSLFRHADLSRVDLSKTDLRFLNLGEANFTGASLDRANMKWTDLKECDFTEASMIGADCSGAILKEAHFKDADLSKAVFDNADMHEATGLTIEQLLSCKSLSNARLPDELKAELKEKDPKLLK